MLTKVTRTTLVEQVTEQLLQLITAPAMTPGAALPSSAQLAANLGVSRTVVREAFKALEARGVIAVANGKNATVQPITSVPLQQFFQRAMQVEQQAVSEFMELRKGLETQSAALAAERRTAHDLVFIQTTFAAMQAHIGDVDAFAELDVTLHLQIAYATRNRMLLHLIESLRETLKDTIRAGRRRRSTPAQLAQIIELHCDVVDAIVASDPQAAARAMALHFDDIAMSIGTPPTALEEK